MKIIIALIALYLIFTIIKCCAALFSLLINRFYAVSLFNKIDLIYKKRYSVIQEILPNKDNSELLQVKNLPDDELYINRKIALNFLLENEVENLFNQEFINLNNKIAEIAVKYNHYAEKLKQNTEIFPASFFARLINIKSVDFIKTKKI